MSRFQIHAGTHKTGSTALQRVLRQVREPLRAAGVFMPGLDEKSAKHGALQLELRDKSRGPSVAAMLADVAAHPEAQSFLLTDEVFISADPVALKSVLDEAGIAEIDIYFYVRPHIGLYASLYLQALKIGRQLHGPGRPGRVGQAAFDFAPAIEGFAEVFGKDHVHVREFSRARLKDGSLTADFWEFLALPDGLLPQAMAVEALANPTPTQEVATLLTTFARHVDREFGGKNLEKRTEAAAALYRALGEVTLPGTPFILERALQEAISARFEPGRAAFAERWFEKEPSPEWLAEPLKDPVPPVDLPHATVVGAFEAAARKLSSKGFGRLSRSAEAFAATLPGSATGSLPTAELAALYPPPPRQKTASAPKRGRG